MFLLLLPFPLLFPFPFSSFFIGAIVHHEPRSFLLLPSIGPYPAIPPPILARYPQTVLVLLYLRSCFLLAAVLVASRQLKV